jgi:hypothetical protein
MKFMTGLLSALALMLVAAGAAQAQNGNNIRTYVSGRTGDDSSSSGCTFLAPCRTLDFALSKTSINGDVVCLDTNVDTNGMTIRGSINIDCSEVNGPMLMLGSSGVDINFDNAVAGDTRKTVRLRGLTLNAGFSTNAGIHIAGATTGTTVIIEDCVIYGNTGGNGRGIDDQRSGGGKLYVTNTTIRDNIGAGISVLPAGGASNIQVMLNNVRSHHNGTGAQFGNLTRVAIDQSAFSGNTGAGILTVAGAIVDVDRSTTSHNANGIQAAGGVVSLANSNIKFNTSQGINNGGGTVFSFGNNRIAFNASPGAAPSPAGGATSDLGQQ